MTEPVGNPTSTKRRRPWLAALANLLFPPLGHFYVGRPARGLVIYLAALGSGVVCAFLFAAGSSALAMALLLALAVGGVFATIVDAFVLARRAGDRFEPGRLNRWFVYIAVVFTTVVVSESVQSYVRSEVVQAFVFPSGSMQPTLLPGDHVLADKRTYGGADPQRGDIVVFEYPEDRNKDYIKRVVGLPGDTIEVKEGVVSIDGETLAEPYASLDAVERKGTMRNYGPFVVPTGTYFVMGDNRDHSHDSRWWGPVDRNKIRGRVDSIYWSWLAAESSVRWSRIGTIVE